MEQTAAGWHALDRHARGLRADGDPRSVSQLMADTLVERVTGQRRATDVAAAVHVMITDTPLLGADDAPGHLPGLGPLPADIARDLATSSRAWLRRFTTNPLDATAATIDTRRRRFHGPLRDLIIARDQRCHHAQDHPALTLQPAAPPTPTGTPTGTPPRPPPTAALLRWITPIDESSPSPHPPSATAPPPKPNSAPASTNSPQPPIRHRNRTHHPDIRTRPRVSTAGTALNFPILPASGQIRSSCRPPWHTDARA